MTTSPAPNVGTLKRVLRSAAISVGGSFALSIAAMSAVFGVDMSRMVPVSTLFAFGISMSLVVPLILAGFVSWRRDVAIRERDRLVRELNRIAQTDQLTGVANRRGFDAAARAVIERCRFQPGESSALMVDVDFFKSINDRFGHDFGDAVLIRVAHSLRDLCAGQGYVLGRQGGEEFVVLLPDTGPTKASVFAERIRSVCSSVPIEHDGHTTNITLSIGVASQPHAVLSLADLLCSADDALYRAKRTGRNRVAVQQPPALPEVA